IPREKASTYPVPWEATVSQASRIVGIMPVTRTCDHCGQTFERPPSARGRFCSRTCYAASMVGEQRVPDANCPDCGDSFRPRKGRKYCSRACYDATQRRRNNVSRTCEQCGGAFTCKEREVGTRPDGYRGGVYCSAACRRAARRRQVEAMCETCGTTFST